MKIPEAELIEVKFMKGYKVQQLKFRYKYRNATYYEHIYLTDYHLNGKVKVSTGPTPSKFKIEERDFIKIAIQMLYYNIIKNIEKLNEVYKK